LREKILITSQKLLGDLIVQTAAYAALRDAFPDARIVLLCDERFVDALKTNDHLDEIWGMPFAATKREPRLARLWGKARMLFGTAWRIRRAQFTRVLVTDVSNKACAWAIFSGAKIKAGIGGQLWSFLLTHTLREREGSGDFLDYYLKQASLIGATNLKRTTYFPLSKKTANFKKQSHLIAIHPGASLAEKRWPAANWAELIEILAKRKTAAQFVLLAGPGENFLCEEIFACLNTAKARSRVRLTGELPLVDSAEIMASASVLFCLDSASRHLAAALHVPTVALMTRWILPLWGLYSEKEDHRVVLSDAPRDSYSIAAVSVADVLGVFDQGGRAKVLPRRQRSQQK